MNIRNLLGINSSVTPAGSVNKMDRPIKSSESSTDREPAGQYFQQKQKNKEKMSDEQFEKAISIMKEKEFMKEMNWVVSALTEDDHRYAWVQDQQGITIRKVSEYDLWELFDEPALPSAKGQLLKKTA